MLTSKLKKNKASHSNIIIESGDSILKLLNILVINFYAITKFYNF